jgi:polar amino acid transport system substrate-binding protein
MSQRATDKPPIRFLQVIPLLLSLCFVGPSMADPLRLVANAWAPYTDRRLLNNGLAADLVSTALKRAGYASEYLEVPWARAIRGLQQGRYDIVIGAWYSEERASFGAFSTPYLSNRIRLIKRKGTAIAYQRLEDLYPYSIAVVRDYAYDPAFDADAKLERVRVRSFEVAANMLAAGRVDLAVEDEYAAGFHFRRSLRSVRAGLEFLSPPLSENGLHILVRRSLGNYAQIVEGFDRAIEAMKSDGSYERLIDRHDLR